MMTSIAWLLRCPFIALFLALTTASLVAAPPVPALAEKPKLDVPYVPTPTAILEKMLEFAAPTKDDYLIDLGCGDGRIPITAAKQFGTRGFGVDIDPERISEAQANAKEAGVTDKVKFRVADLFDTEIKDATILTLYLLPSVNLKLRPRILDELRPGTRVVSHDFDMGDWLPDKRETVGHKTVYKWIVPAKVNGNWSVRDTATGTEFALNLTQRFQMLEGEAVINGRRVPIRSGHMEGERIVFELPNDNGTTRRYEGRVSGKQLAGDGWQAKPSS